MQFKRLTPILPIAQIIVCTIRPGSPPPNLTIDLAMRSQWTSAYLPASLAPVGETGLLVGDAMSSLAILDMTSDSGLHTVAKARPPVSSNLVVFANADFVSLHRYRISNHCGPPPLELSTRPTSSEPT